MDSRWCLDFDKFIKRVNRNCVKEDSEQKIKAFQPELEELLNSAKSHYSEGNLEECARTLRRLANNIKDLEFETTTAGIFHERNTLNDLTGKEWLRHTKSWIIKDGKPSDIPKEIKNHPASFPPDLAKHFIEFFTKKAMWVIDPFMGIGSTLAACNDLERNCIGTELNTEFAGYAQSRAKNPNIILKVYNEDCRKIVKIFNENNYPHADFLITSPPYWNMLAKSRGGVESTHKKRKIEGLMDTYGEYKADLSNISEYPEFMKELVNIFASIKSILKKDAYLVIIVQNVRTPEGKVLPFAWDLAYKLAEHYELKQEVIWCQDQKFLGIWGYPTHYVSNVHHHYCLIFQNS
jgi:DNA modification methylase